MSPLRNWADDLSFQDWLFGKVMPVEDRLRSDDAYWGALLSCLEMIRSGTTCFLDMHMFPQSSVLAAQETGMRAVISRGLSGGTEDPGYQDGKSSSLDWQPLTGNLSCTPCRAGLA